MGFYPKKQLSSVDLRGGVKISGTSVTSNAAELNQLDGKTGVVDGVAAGYKVARGTQAATASAVIATGLTTITGYAVSSIGATATAANNAALITAKASAGNLTVYRWKHTGASTATFTAASTAGTVSFIAVGT